MKINWLEKFLGSGFYTGYIKFASGTFGSAAALVVYLIPGVENPAILIALIAVSIVVGIPISTKFEKIYGKDPSECTIDEFTGMWIALLFLPKVWWLILITFLLWRALDIVKPFPARQAEALKGGLGIMLDDIISGFYTFILIQISINLFFN